MRTLCPRLVVLALLVVTLPGCSLVGPDVPPAPVLAWSRVDVPLTLLSTGERVDVDAVQPALAGQPSLLVGTRQDGTGIPRLTAWTERAGGDGWTLRTLVPAADDPASFAGVAVAGATTWVAASSWTPGDGSRSLLLSSTDRVDWDVRELAAGVRAQALVVVDDEPLVIGQDERRAPVVVRPDQAVAALPAPGDGVEARGVTGVAAAGDVVVATGLVGAPGAPDATTVYRSDDAGRSWTVDVSGLAAIRAAGVVRTTDRFVVTGSRRTETGGSVPAVWSSTDGLSWAEEPVPTLAKTPDPPREGEDWGLSDPAPAPGGAVVVAAWTQAGLRSSVLRRDPGGSWAEVAYTDVGTEPGTAASVGGQADGGVLVVRSALGQTVVQTVESTGGRGPRSRFGDASASLSWARTSTGTTPVHLEARRTVVSVEGEGRWARTSEAADVTWDGRTASSAEPDPPEAAALTGALRRGATSSTGEPGPEVVLGTWFDLRDDATQTSDDGGLRGWVRTGPDQPWTPATGLDAPGFEAVNDLRWTSSGWVAVGVAADDALVGTPRAAAVWTSPDGVAWTRDPGSLALPDTTDSASSDVCDLPDGTLVVPGSRQRPDGTWEPAAWHRGAAGWSGVPSTAFGAASGGTSSCVPTPDGVLVGGTRDGRATVWRTTDGRTFEIVHRGTRGDDLGDLVPVDGAGFAAAGSTDVGGVATAALWTSPDGVSWSAAPLPVPSVATGQVVVVDADGDRLLVGAASGAGLELWALDDAASVVRRGG